eukprot:jgi/Ulvmu1/2640/UM014_0092.1
MQRPSEVTDYVMWSAPLGAPCMQHSYPHTHSGWRRHRHDSATCRSTHQPSSEAEIKQASTSRQAHHSKQKYGTSWKQTTFYTIALPTDMCKLVYTPALPHIRPFNCPCRSPTYNSIAFLSTLHVFT